MAGLLFWIGSARKHVMRKNTGIKSTFIFIGRCKYVKLACSCCDRRLVYSPHGCDCIDEYCPDCILAAGTADAMTGRKLKDRRYKVVLVDLRLPEADGTDVVRAVHQVTPSAVITGQPESTPLVQPEAGDSSCN